MIRLPRILLVAALVLPTTLLAQAGGGVPVVSLAEARRMAWTVDPAAVGAHGEVATANWERRSAYAGLLTPNVTAATSYVTFSDPFINFGTGSVSPNATSATLEAEYTLVGGGKLAEVRRSRAGLASAEAIEAAVSFRSALATDAAYYSVLADVDLARVATDRLARAREQLGVSRVRVQAGQTIATDSLQLVLEVNRALIEVLRRDSALVVSRLRLGRRIGMSGPAAAAPTSSAAPPALPLTLDAASAELLAQGPELRAARAAEHSASAVLAAERWDYMPSLSVSAIVGAYDSEFFPEALKRNQLAFTVSWPIWTSGQREVEVARARAQRDLARAERDDKERGSAQRMAEAYNGYSTARAGVDLASVGVAVSTENYRVQGARYREGATTILDLLEAQVALSAAEAAVVQARYGARLALAEIEALLGRRLFEEQ